MNYLERVEKEDAQKNLTEILNKGYNLEGFNSLIAFWVTPADLAEIFTEMYFEMSQILLHLHKEDKFYFNENWSDWLFDFKLLIGSLKYMDEYNINKEKQL